MASVILRSVGRTFLLAFFVCVFASFSGEAQTQPPNTYKQKIRTFHTAEEFEKLTQGKVKINREKAPNQNFFSVKPVIVDVLPVRTRHGLRAEYCFGTEEGLYKKRLNSKYEFFAGKRWLPDDNVIGIGSDSRAIWVETSKGYSRIEYKTMTLEEKSKAFVECVQKRHNRWGLTADSHLTTPGDLTTNQMISTDNDGLWTAMYVAAECFRYKVTGEKDARENARVGMNALMRLEEISGISGFPARSFIKVGVDEQPKDGEWHDTPDKIWRWKGDTSSDEIVGHYFVYPIYLDLVADATEKPKLIGVIDRITNHILDHKYQLVDLDGKRTMWGFWGPDQIWDDPDELGIRALHILAHLRVAMHMTTNSDYRAKYEKAYFDLIKNHKYHLLTRNQKIMVPGHINHSDDELAFLSYYPLLQYETDPGLRKVYQDSLERSWLIEKPERNPLWNFIYAVGCEAKDFDSFNSVKTLQEIPMDMIHWTVKNSNRWDVPMDPMSDRFKKPQALIVLPYDELPMSKWNGNPYNVDGGNGGRSEDDGAYFLLPYWMGRFHKLISE